MKNQFKKLLILALISVPTFMSGMNHLMCLTDELPIRPDKKDPTDLPELPSQDGITCEYDGSYLIIKFENGEGMVSMELSYASDGCEIDRVNFSASSDFVYYIGEINEPVKVEITGAGRYYCEVMD